MKKLLLILLLFFSSIVYAVDVTQFYAGHAGKMNLIIWTVSYEEDISGYVIEKNGVEVWQQDAHGFESAGYYFYDPALKGVTIYTLKVVYSDGRTEIRGTEVLNARARL